MVSSAFANQAQYQAEMLRLPDVRLSFVRHPISDASPEALAGKAEESLGPALQAISQSDLVEEQAWVHAAPQGCASGN